MGRLVRQACLPSRTGTARAEIGRDREPNRSQASALDPQSADVRKEASDAVCPIRSRVENHRPQFIHHPDDGTAAAERMPYFDDKLVSEAVR
jgi:hypothetical protein